MSGCGWGRRSWYRVGEWWRASVEGQHGSSKTSPECRRTVTVDEIAQPRWRQRRRRRRRRRSVSWTSPTGRSSADEQRPQSTVVAAGCRRRSSWPRALATTRACFSGSGRPPRQGNEFNIIQSAEQVAQWDTYQRRPGEHRTSALYRDWPYNEQMSTGFVQVDGRLDCVVSTILIHFISQLLRRYIYTSTC